MLFSDSSSPLVTIRCHKDLLATAHSNKIILLRNGTEKVEKKQIDTLLNCLEWSHDGSLGVGCEDGTVRQISQNGETISSAKGHESAVLSCAWDITGRLLVSGGLDECLCLWELGASKRPIANIPAHSDPVLSVAFNGDGYKVASASVDGLIRVWDVRASLERCLATIVDDDNPVVSSVQWSPNGQFLLSASMDNAVRLWDYESRMCARTYKGVRFGRIGRARFMRQPDSSGYAILAGGENGLWGWNPQSKVAIIKPDQNGQHSIIDFDTMGDCVYYINGTDGVVHAHTVK